MFFKLKGSVNGGICVVCPDGKKVWVDFTPGKTVLWEELTPEDWETVKNDSTVFPPDLVLTTHCHSDHFSPERTEELLRLCPDAQIFVPAWRTPSDTCQHVIPADSLDVFKIAGDTETVTSGNLEIQFLRSTHSGKKYEDVPHYSILLRYGKKTIFFSGDARVMEEELTDQLEFINIDLAVLNFPWASLTKGRELVEYSIRPSHVFLVHLPAREKDIYSYREAAENGAGLLNVPDVRLFLTHFQEEVFDL